jgi:hypothetical protein
LQVRDGSEVPHRRRKDCWPDDIPVVFAPVATHNEWESRLE